MGIELANEGGSAVQRPTFDEIQRDLKLVRQQEGVSVRRISRHGQHLQTLRISQEEFRRSGSQPGTLPMATITALECAVHSFGSDSVFFTLLDTTLNFRGVRTSLTDRQQMVMEALGMYSKTTYESYEKDIYSQFAYRIDRKARSFCVESDAATAIAELPMEHRVAVIRVLLDARQSMLPVNQNVLAEDALRVLPRLLSIKNSKRLDSLAALDLATISVIRSARYKEATSTNAAGPDAALDIIEEIAQHYWAQRQTFAVSGDGVMAFRLQLALERRLPGRIVQADQAEGFWVLRHRGLSFDAADASAAAAPRSAIHRVWPNFEVTALIHRSIVTTKCDAAQRSFDATGSGLVWAVLDSGIDGQHGHFALHGNLDVQAVGLTHRSFLSGSHDDDALVDASGHGTHVAGIIAGEQVSQSAADIVVASSYHDGDGETVVRSIILPRISGMAPRCKLLSCKVLREDRSGDVATLLDALEYIQDLNQGGRELKVHGVNLSVGYPFDPSWFATGLTPVCREVDRLVRSGVVVVVAAGNTGYGYALDSRKRQFRLGFDMTINDPGNTERAITVGSTSITPHVSGISYFSSKGPTGDGRLKPDLVAPGERIISAGSGALLAAAQATGPAATYVENSGTSMAAPHVSGAAAAFLSVHREFIGRPEDVKRILLDTATDIGRSRTFQGRGVLDLMRAIQSV
ncbi:S8 family peptidase [Mycolicibacterium fluoranthenivorans]|uniref:S8 family peptidase n=1 Tax=Mycolicibacterium fluoranthenivorans TaxID=258505 RepID=UPI00147F6CF1|nr:S8 family peptidase [Mycolicibacterium fluoranthenivorans]